MENRLFVRLMLLSAIGLCLWLFWPFLKSFFLALLLAMVVYPLHRLVELRLGRFSRLEPVASPIAAAVVTLGLSLIMFVPIALFVYELFDHPESSIASLRALGDRVDALPWMLPPFLAWLQEPLYSVIALGKVHKDEIVTALASWLGSGLTTFIAMLAEMAMIVVFFFFLTWYGRSIALFFLPIIPLARDVKREFLSDMVTTTAVVFYTFGGVMLAQGVAFGVLIAFFDGYNPFLLGFMTAVSAIIPVVGTALVWVPVALNEYFEGEIFNALVIAVYSWAVMAFFIDNIVKLVILNFVNRAMSDGKRKMNEFVIFFAIVGGLATFGFWGFVFGPAIVAFAITTLRIVRKRGRGGCR
ncbi:AI-2E family transporter [Sulfuricurvum sp. IAE1]|uniref:AI-2E family transporter n=1 Tax=Sulfuricurvum sp. IAE1 TaxID=2546102 RepID=UPI00104890D0|nr:AI-2E family transporter [Sulfuricurvum sp. IAE1]TDA62825.1 AI-2E family transporter [Sulfuricurvum sp. IAE1]